MTKLYTSIHYLIWLLVNNCDIDYTAEKSQQGTKEIKHVTG